MPARGIQHIDLAVSDVARSLAFYTSLLGPAGLKEEERYATYRGTEEVVYVSVGDEWLGLRPADGGAHRYYGVGLEHLAFEVDSQAEVDAAHQRCTQRGDRIHHPPEEDGDIAGYYAFFVFDPDGLRIEVFTPGPRWSSRIHRTGAETAILAGGCFWGVQELLRRRDGVISTRVGYSGGESADPTEADPGGHAEAVEVVFDPERISYRDILEFFFQIHDPTTKDRQGDETGSYVRSEIFATSAEQRRVAEETIGDVEASGLWPGEVVTRISDAARFWEAPAEDQDYLQRHPEGETCHFPRPGWKLPRRETSGSR